MTFEPLMRKSLQSLLIVRTAHACKKMRLLILAACLVLLACNPCAAISQKISSFAPVSPADAAAWVKRLGLEDDPAVKVKSISLRLRDATMSVTRVESRMCKDDVCPTYFKYQIDRVFEFIIPCRESVVILDTRRDPGAGFKAVDFILDVGSSLSSWVTPTSHGPLIRTERRIY